MKRKLGKNTYRPFVLASVMLGMFLAAIEGTIVATAMPSIIADLGGFSLYSWVFSSYLLTSASTVLIFGKLSDVYGRKPIFTIGIAVFLLGSTLSGWSHSIEMLLLARFIQGIGAGALMPMATTIVGDMYAQTERAKIQGYLSSVWGISAVSGPLLGGFFIDVLNWRYIFWMNIPLGILSMLGVLLFLQESNQQRRSRPIHYRGTMLLFIAISSFILCLSHIGKEGVFQAVSPLVWVLIIAISLIGFYIHENRVQHPMMPSELWKNPYIVYANIISFITGMILIGVSSFLPAFVQGVMGESATIAGFTLTTMSIGWPIASTIAGKLLYIIGYWYTSLLGGFALMVGSLFFLFLSSDKGPVWAGTGSFFIGIGMGLTSTAFIVAIQSNVSWEIRGIATASNLFSRSLGSVVGVAFLGGILNKKVLQYMKHRNETNFSSLEVFNVLLHPTNRDKLPLHTAEYLQEGLTLGLHAVHISLFMLSLVSFIGMFFMLRHR